MVDEHFLLHGAVLSLEQSGRLLKSTVTLIDDGDYATAIVLSAFAHEELGRYLILRRLRKSVLTDGAEVSLQDIERARSDHQTRQKEGQGSTSMNVPNDSALGRALKVVMNPDPDDRGNPSYWEAQALIDDAMERKRKRQPNDRHLMRMTALYVEPDDASTSNRPADIDQLTAKQAVSHAANAYSWERHRLTNALEGGSGDGTDWEYATAMRAWTDCPELPEPVWPS